jgi:hypothetical protein
VPFGRPEAKSVEHIRLRDFARRGGGTRAAPERCAVNRIKAVRGG